MFDEAKEIGLERNIKKLENIVTISSDGIPAFATPAQEKLGIDFNDKKIDLIVDLIDRTTARV